MTQKAHRTLNYRRCQFLEHDPTKPTLQSYAHEALKRLSAIKDRSLDTATRTLEVDDWLPHNTDGLYLHLTGYTPDAKTALTSKDKSGQRNRMDTDKAKDGYDFVEGDSNILIRGNHLVFCSTVLHETTIAKYLKALFAASLDEADHAIAFSLEKIAKVSQVQMIKDQGIKRIILDSSIYEASMREMDASTRWNLLGSMVKSNPTLAECQQDESLSARLVLSKGKKDMPITQQRLTKIGQSIIEEDEGEGGWTIVTKYDQTIRSGEIMIKESRAFEPYGNTIFQADARTELLAFMNELDAQGILDNN